MNKMIKVGLAAFSIAVTTTGCMTSSLATADSTSEKWEKFKSIQPSPYTAMGFAKVDKIGNNLSTMTDVYVKDVVIPYIEADKEGYIGVVAQFMEDVAAAKAEGKTENDVLAAWNERYGAENVAKLDEALKFVRQQQNGKNALLAIAVAKAPEFVALKDDAPAAIDEIKAGASDPFTAAKLANTANQLVERIDAVIWSIDLLKTLSADKAAETAALQEYVDSFKSKVN